MALLATLIGIPAMAAVGLTILLNDVHAGAGVAVASLSLVAALGGAAIGYYVDRLPGSSRARRGAARPRRPGAGASG